MRDLGIEARKVVYDKWGVELGQLHDENKELKEAAIGKEE